MQIYFGGFLYFPKYKERKNWGESTGAQSFYKQRNKEIKEKYKKKISVDVLALEYNLSVETIRKIIFERRLV